jgi:predicted house-cleaning noncanonical NTP pyrophosphatase (MazG superfamily)
MTEEEFESEITKLSRSMAMTILEFAKDRDMENHTKYREVLTSIVHLNIDINDKLAKIKNTAEFGIIQ